jgi:hypothetical protein
MAPPTGTFQTYSATTNREDLQDWIANISPTDRPFTSKVGESEATNVLHEWSTDSLAAPSTSNAQIEGDDLAGSTSVAPTRQKNYCQISTKDVTVARSQRKSNLAGTQDFYDYQVVKKGREILRDMEAIVTQNQGYNPGAASVARRLRSLESWLSTNTSQNSVSGTGAGAPVGGSSVGFGASAASVPRTDATALRPLTEAYLKATMQLCFTQGGNPSLLFVGPFNKTVVSGFAGRASTREIVDKNTIQGAASMYASDFGDLTVVPNRFQRERSAFLIDPEYVGVSYFDRMHEEEIAKTGDSDKTMIVVEYTLEMKNEAAHGGIFDIATS